LILIITNFLHPGKSNIYNATVTAIQGNQSETASTTVNVIDTFNTNTARFLYLSLGFFTALMVIIIINIKDNLLKEILRFVCLSGIVLSLLASLLFTNVTFGSGSAIGIINVGDRASVKWVFDIGGFLQIPIYVVIFGLLGGYLRYIYKTSKLIETVKIGPFNTNKDNNYKSTNNREESKDTILNHNKSNISGSKYNLTENERRERIFYQSIQDVMLFFLSPLLAIAAYFLLIIFGLCRFYLYFSIS